MAPGGELLRTPDEPALRVRPDIWARGRITELLQKATPEQRQRLEEEIGRRRKALQGRKDVEGLRAFVALFGTETAVGREARLELARRLVEKEDYAAADQLLQGLRRQRGDTALAARAVLELARMRARRGLLADAVHYYRILARDFPRTEVEGKKTGAEFFEELQTDKRYLSFLQEAPPAFPAGRLKAAEEKGSFPYSNQVYHFPQRGERLPFFVSNRLALHLGLHKLQLLDAATEEERWGTTLTRTNFQQLLLGNGQPHRVEFPFQNVGHLVVLPLGETVCGIDPVGRRKLWEKDLTGTANVARLPPRVVSYGAEAPDGSLRVTYADGWVQRLGAPLALTPTVLCLPTRAGLEGIDPLTGQVLWAREDVPGNADVFADERTAFVVTLGPDDRPRAARAFRLDDGREVRVPDFAGAYGNRLRTAGHHILVSDTDAGRVRLRLYDVRAGKDVWERTYAPRSVVLRSAAPGLAGVAEPDGTVHVLGTDGAELLKAKVKPEHLAGVAEAHLLADRDSFYVACVRPAEAAVAAFGGVRPNLVSGTGLRALPVNGTVYAFTRSTGKLRWYSEMPNQTLVLNHFGELPLLLFTATYQKWMIKGEARSVEQVTAAYALEKRTGKRLYDIEVLPRGMQFHTLKVDTAGGSVDLVGHQLKISFTVAGK
jgi:outer membrane protein assembly factor BamB